MNPNLALSGWTKLETPGFKTKVTEVEVNC